MEPISGPMPSISALIVEDEKVTLELLAILLASKFPDVAFHTAINGRTGLELFKTHRPDIVITDLIMPEMGGAQMADRIRAIKPDTKFIFISGYTGKLLMEDSVEKEFVCDHFFVKPVCFPDFFAAIELCLAEIAHHQPNAASRGEFNPT
jgi:YesN/AraC family two-component response regulator